MNDSSGIIKPSSEREWPKADKADRRKGIEPYKASPIQEEFASDVGVLSQAQFDKKWGK